jgi:naringenin degradation protein FdeH
MAHMSERRTRGAPGERAVPADGGVRRVVTGVDDDGRSVFVSDGPANGSAQWAEVWVTDPVLGLDAVVDPHDGPMVLEPPAGGSAWRVFEVPPDDVMREQMGSAVGHMDGVEADGFHTTSTVDLVMVLEGEIALELDDGEVLLGPGDCVVQRATRHAWRNRSGGRVRMMAVMLSLQEAADPEDQGNAEDQSAP